MQGFEIEFDVTPNEYEIDISDKVIEIKPPLINLEVDPTKEKQVFNHENSYGYDEVVVNPVTNEVDENIKPNNIRAGVNILGVEGTIENIDYWSTEAPNSSEFYLDRYVKELPKNIDTSKITSGISLSSSYFLNLEKADLSNWDLSKVTSLRFESLPKLKEIIIDNYNTENLGTLYRLCYGCKTLENVVLKINTSNLNSIDSAFRDNQKLKELDLSTWETPNVTNVSYAWYNCTQLMKLDIRNMTFDKVTSGNNVFNNVPKNCLIIVKGETEKQWVLDRRSAFTNVKTVAELGE